MKLLLAVLIGGVMMTGCGVSGDDMQRLMRQEGVTDFQDQGYAFFGCDEKDSFHESFTGTRNGQRVSGVVCGGWFKKYTIRYD